MLYIIEMLLKDEYIPDEIEIFEDEEEATEFFDEMIATKNYPKNTKEIRLVEDIGDAFVKNLIVSYKLK